MLISGFNLQDAKPVNTPGVKPSFTEHYEPLDNISQAQYRALVARTSYLSQDRGDIQFAVKELCRKIRKTLQTGAH